jgi:hypothetical protein
VTGRAVSVALLLACAMTASVLVLRLDRGIADAYIGEDGSVEMAGALLLLVGAGTSGVVFMRSRGVSGDRKTTVKPLAYLAFAVFLFLAAGEELSWGQRIFDFGTPEAVQAINSQDETSLHNLYGDEHGENLSSRLFQAAWVFLGVGVPVAAAAWAPMGRFLRSMLPVFPVWLALLFVGQQLLWYPVQADFRDDPAAWNGTFRGAIDEPPFRVDTRAEALERGTGSPAGLSEIMETNIELLLAVGAFCMLVATPRRRADTGTHPDLADIETNSGSQLIHV